MSGIEDSGHECVWNGILMIDRDDVFDALADTQRRQLLLELTKQEPFQIPELTGETAELSGATEGFLEDCLSGSRDFSAIDTELLRTYYVHLPKLAADGFIEWNRETNLVWKGEQFDGLKPVLDLLADHEDDESATELMV